MRAVNLSLTHNNYAHRVINDEYYTTYEMVEEMMNKCGYDFTGKNVYLPCDTKHSNFYIYFKNNFHQLGIQMLTATCIDSSFLTQGRMFCEKGNKIIYDGKKEYKSKLKGTGDIFSEEVKNMMLSNDIVITNPPFSILSKLYERTLEGVNFMMIIFIISVCYISCQKKLSNNDWYVYLLKNNTFLNGKMVHVGVLSTVIPNIPKFDWSNNDKDIYEYSINSNIKIYNRIANFPKDFKGICYLPFSCFYYKYRIVDNYKIIPSIVKVWKNKKNSYFKRILVASKDISLKNLFISHELITYTD